MPFISPPPEFPKRKLLTNLEYYQGVKVPPEHAAAHEFNITYPNISSDEYFALSKKLGITMDDHQSYVEWRTSHA